MSIQQLKWYIYKLYLQEVNARGMQVSESEQWKLQMSAVCEWLYNQPSTVLMLSGSVGNGKTTILNTIRNAINLKQFEIIGGNDSQKINMPNFDAKELFRDLQDRKEYERVRRLPIIGIDDFGCEPVEYLAFGNAINPLSDLLFDRYKRMNITIITTNLSAKDMREKYDARLCDRFSETATIINFSNPSYRGIK